MGDRHTHRAADKHRDHTLYIRRRLSSLPIDCCYVLWRDWTTPDNSEHLLYSSSAHRPPPYLLLLLTHSMLPYPNKTIPTPTPSPKPASAVPRFPFISFHLIRRIELQHRHQSGTLWRRWSLLHRNPYLPLLHISMLTNGLLFSGLWYDEPHNLFVPQWSVGGVLRDTGAPEVLSNKVRFSWSICRGQGGWHVFVDSLHPLWTMKEREYLRDQWTGAIILS